MMPNVTKGSRMVSLVKYLAGPGRANEHTQQRVISSSASIVSVDQGEHLSAESALRLGYEMDIPKAVFGQNHKGKHVFHVSLSLAADEGKLSDETWASIAKDFVKEMGFEGVENASPCRWVAIHHGGSKAGNDHIHIAVSMIAEDGRKWSQNNDQPRSQAAAVELEKKYGLRVARGEHAERGYHPKEMVSARAQGLPELARETLQRCVRAASTASVDEAEFVRRLRGTGVLIRPRFAKDSTSVVEGFSVALKPKDPTEKAVWFGGGRLARDLTLPKLRAGWDGSPEAGEEARAEWEAVTGGKRPASVGREAVEPTAEQWEAYTAEVGSLYEKIKSVPLDDPGMWAQVARETSGVFAAWSLRTEAVPGPLAETSKALSRTAQLRRFPTKAKPAPLPSAKGAGMLMMQTSVGPSSRAGEALLLAQLRNTMRAVHDMHKATGSLNDAQRIRTAAMDRLAAVKTGLEQAPTMSSTAPVALAEKPKSSSRWLDAAQDKDPEIEEVKRLIGLNRPDAKSVRSSATEAPVAAPEKKDQGKSHGRSR